MFPAPPFRVSASLRGPIGSPSSRGRRRTAGAHGSAGEWRDDAGAPVTRGVRVGVGVLCAVLGAAALLGGLLSLLAALGCCAIDCERFAEKCAENERAQHRAGMTALGSLVTAAGLFTASARLSRRPRID